jgi:hypothetical protein
MSASGNNIMNRLKAGKMNLEELNQSFAGASASAVTVQDWGVCYSSATGELAEYCTIISNNGNDPITGLGMIAYTSDGSQMLCVQYTNDISSPSVATSIGTTLYNPNQGNQILCIVYGWTTNTNYYVSKTISIVPCQ